MNQRNLSKGILFLLLQLPLVVFAQLPELAMPSTGSGAETSARFFGGASPDNGLSFGDDFAFDQALDITGEIQVEEAHIGTVGNLYLVVQVGEDLLIRDASGSYIPWDLDIATLQATTVGKTLSAIEPLTIVDDVALGPAGVSGTTLSIFFAYDSAANPGELYYSGSPLMVAVQLQAEEQPTEPQSFTLFTNNISQPIIQSRCIACHVSGGAASSTRLVYVRSNVADFQTQNYNTLLDFIQTAGSSLLLSKPQGIGHGGGVQLQSGSAEFTAWSEFISAAESDL